NQTMTQITNPWNSKTAEIGRQGQLDAYKSSLRITKYRQGRRGHASPPSSSHSVPATDEKDSVSVSIHASPRALRTAASWWRPVGARLDRGASGVFILPAVVVILAFSIFPLLASLYVSLSRLGFSEGGVELKFVGFGNYAK